MVKIRALSPGIIVFSVGLAAPGLLISLLDPAGGVAAIHAQHFADRLDFRQPIKIIPRDFMPKPEEKGNAVRDGNTCLIHISKTALHPIRDDIIAHEVCHCAADWDHLGMFGYRPGTGIEARDAMEERATRCENKLMGLVP